MSEKHRRESLVVDEWNESNRKRLRTASTTHDESQHHDHTHTHTHTHNPISDSAKDFTIAATAKHARETVAPFLAKHIPAQYAPLGNSGIPQTLFTSTKDKDSNSKFCYRHRPDKLCRRQADEPSMEKLQHDLESLDQQDRQGIVQVWSLFSAAPSKYRNLMLKGILAQCCFPQLSFLSANVRELIRIDFLSALPSEVSFRILCFLDTTSLCKAAQVSRKWRQLADDDVVWHRMCEQHIDRKCTTCGWGLPLLERKLLRSSKRQIELRAAGIAAEGFAYTQVDHAETGDPSTTGDDDSHSEATVVDETQDGSTSPLVVRRPRIGTSDSELLRARRPWKDVYKDRFKVGTNWKYGRCSINILKGHSNGVMALQLLDNFLATGSYDATIKIWNIETGEEVRTLRGHTMGIRCLQFDENKLISGSLDKSLKVWNWRTGECISTFNGHSEGVIALHFDSDILVSGSVDNTARVWNFRDKSVFTLRGHTDWVNSVRIDSASRTIFTASDDCTVKLWDLDTKKCIHTFEGHVGQVQTVLPLPAEFEADECQVEDDEEASDPGSPSSSSTTGSTYGGIKILTRKDRHPSLYHTDASRPQPPRYMLTSALDSTIRLWDVHSGRCIKKFFGHVEGVWAVAADTLRIVSGAEDRMVKVWDPRTGKCERTFTGHAGPVTCIGLSESRMVSAGEDGEVRVYNFTA
ncbi:hypothetical protein LTR84_009518 [Exophiala bonariae]|uniref:Probable E3 ubiquitin ligase complex SCF subunit sconB n=1 Tax=Exophiala bonariae TaxID=1690606 RepID=A0AAV9MX71_9EURO|nr:hypothetical protein LTR84_009518 [Exophiala bonariae]